MKRKNLVLSIQLLPSAASLRALACVPGRLFRDRVRFPNFLACEQSSPIWVNEGSLARTRERGGRGKAHCGFAARSRVLVRLASLAQIGELARRLPIFCLAKQTDTATNEGLECEPSLFNLFTVVNFVYHLSWLNKFLVHFPPTQLLIILIIFSFKTNPIIHVMFEVSLSVFLKWQTVSWSLTQLPGKVTCRLIYVFVSSVNKLTKKNLAIITTAGRIITVFEDSLSRKREKITTSFLANFPLCVSVARHFTLFFTPKRRFFLILTNSTWS